MMVGLSPALSGPNASAYILLSICIVSTVRLCPRKQFFSARLCFTAPNRSLPALSQCAHCIAACHPITRAGLAVLSAWLLLPRVRLVHVCRGHCRLLGLFRTDAQHWYVSPRDLATVWNNRATLSDLHLHVSISLFQLTPFVCVFLLCFLLIAPRCRRCRHHSGHDLALLLAHRRRLFAAHRSHRCRRHRRLHGRTDHLCD